MNKLEEICKKFSSLKNNLNESDIQQLCQQPYKSLVQEMKKLNKDDSSSINKSDLNTKNNQINSNLKKADNCYKNLLISLASSEKLHKENNNNKNKEKNNNINNSPNIERSRSPSINEGDDDSKITNKEKEKEKNFDILDKELTNEFKTKIIPLNEDEDENNESSNNINKSNKNHKTNKNISFYIIDKTDKNLNINEKITEFLDKYDDKLSSMSKNISQMKLVDNFFYKSKESLLIKYIVDNNIINIDTIKKIIHLCFNVLSKVFSTLIKEPENKINSYFNDISDIINMQLNFIKLIKDFIKNNDDNVDVTFLKEMKNIANYCLYVIIIKKYNYEYMNEIENKNENEKKIEFFRDYKKYFKIINKIKPIFKENNLFMKHFMVQPNMISFIDLLEMNRKIINFQLNVNFKM